MNLALRVSINILRNDLINGWPTHPKSDLHINHNLKCYHSPKINTNFTVRPWIRLHYCRLHDNVIIMPCASFQKDEARAPVDKRVVCGIRFQCGFRKKRQYWYLYNFQKEMIYPSEIYTVVSTWCFGVFELLLAWYKDAHTEAKIAIFPIALFKDVCILIQIALKFVSKITVDKSALVQQ